MKRIVSVLLVVAILAAIGSVVPVYFRHYKVQEYLEDTAHYAVVERNNDKVAAYFVKLLKEDGIDEKIRKSMLGVTDLKYRVGVIRTLTKVEIRFDYYEAVEVPYVDFRHQFDFVDVATWDLE